MNRTLAAWLLRAYPRAWRERYGDELEYLLHAERYGLRAAIDILSAALRERWSPSVEAGLSMNACSGSILSLSKQPSAFVPMAMSVAALTVLGVSLAMFGVPPPHADEGATAHIWQLLMTLQFLGIGWFAFKWLRKSPRVALGVLGIQVALALAAMAPVYILGL